MSLISSIVQIPDFKPVIPGQRSFDGVSVVVFFAVYPFLAEGTSFCIRGNEILTQKPYFINFPIAGKVKTQGLLRTVNGDSRSDLPEICFALQRCVKWYRNNSDFIALIREAIKGISAYQKKYERNDPVIDTLQQTIDKIQQVLNIHLLKGTEKANLEDVKFAIEWLDQGVDSNKLNNQEKAVYECWSANELSALLMNIKLASDPKTKDEGLSATMAYIETKQKKMSAVLQEEEKYLK